MEKTPLELTKRKRAKGTGPRRNKLKPFVKLGVASNNVVWELNTIIDQWRHNDIGGDNYAITNSTSYDKSFGISKTDSTYRQILLQENKTGIEDVDEFRYSTWNGKYFIRYCRNKLDEHFSNTYRFRLSEMSGHHEIKWHIDTCTSVACRAQLCLSDDDSIFEFKTKDGIHQLKMQKGEIWFINTGWNHRVVSGHDTRRTAIWSCHFDDIIEKDKLWK